MRVIDLNKRTRYGSSLEEELYRFILVMQENGIYANGILVESMVEPSEGIGIAHFGSLDKNDIRAFWTKVIELLDKYPPVERQRIRVRDEKVN